MANKYCNLIGTKKISEDFGNINIGFDKVQQDMEGNKSVADSHIADKSIHVTQADKDNWNSKAPGSTLTDFNAHKNNGDIHVTKAKKDEWDSKAPGNTKTELDAHVSDKVVHVTQDDHDKLGSIEEGAEVNQLAFSKVNDVSAKSKTDSLKIKGGIGITVSSNPDTNEVTVTATGDATPGPHAETHLPGGTDVIPFANETVGGLMSEQDKKDIGQLKTQQGQTASALDAHASDTTKHITAAERSAWNGKETPEGAQAKANQAESNAKSHANTVANQASSQAETNAKNASVPRSGGTINGDLAVTNTLYVASRNVIWEIDQAKQSGVDAKNRIAGAVSAKGVPASAADDWPTLAAKVGQIFTGVPIARIKTNVSDYPKNFLISDDDKTTWGLYYIMVTGLSFQTKGIVVLNPVFRAMAAFDFYTNPRISVDGAGYNHQVVYRDTLPNLSEYSILATITPNSFLVPVTRYDSESNSQVHVIAYG
ncbi:hypothetical protein M5X06_18805 [Paenibacillus alvei]|uniref:Uncharacterized protein n=1 Tax=Paenibacillus alvei TaxID=44250 RepID=A0ABT4GW65_PAEAL|nr:hypothetical protein [Paenibacillus alvei]MCY9760935.1 hypothetical protein [Paenibacillus alvei]MCY9768855.1 hypothetical protein [Paenibacillus alvei]